MSGFSPTHLSLNGLSSGAASAGARAVLPEHQTLWDWRRRISELYAQVRSSEPLQGWQQWCAARDDLFRHHSQSPITVQERAQFPGVPYFAYDSSFRYLLELGEPADTEPLSMPAGRDGEVKLQPFARTRGLAPHLGNELTLYWIGGYGGGVFLPFRDATSGRESFAGGRYLLDTIKGADLGCSSDGRVILDFNFAYNPSCSYSDQWVCPLAPADNTLPYLVRAGERSRN
jgi:uncharacterized protein (DUF1684 family)